MSVLLYQLFNGVDSDDYKVKINSKDEVSGEVFDSVIYPDALEEVE
ncbi:hypothetical protein [Psychrobacillus antarcticus]|nr:hypothetical protein [Psychrobacillus antarcticus]